MPRRARGVGGDELEAAFQARVIGLLRVYQWERIYHEGHGGHGSTRTGTKRHTLGKVPEGRGFPDVLAIHPRESRILVAELKGEAGELRPGQREWLEAFAGVGEAVEQIVRPPRPGRGRRDPGPRVEAYLWRPSDWDELHDVIRGRRPRRRDLDPPPPLTGPAPWDDVEGDE